MIYLPEDVYLTPRIRHIEQLMVSAMRQVIPDVRIAVESAVMYRWAKKAELMQDENGNMLVWTPERWAEYEARKKAASSSPR